MKVKVNLTNQTLECLDNKPYIQGYDTRNKLIVYVPTSVVFGEGDNIQIAYQLQNGRNTIKLPNNGVVEATLEDDTTPNPDYIEGYNGFIFNAFTNAGEPLAVTNQAGNFTATLVFKVSGNTYKLNVLNTVLKSTDFEEFESAVEGVAQEVLFSLESMSDIVTELQQTIDDIAANDFTEEEAKEIFYTKTQSDSKYAKFKLITNIANIPAETLASLEVGDILVSSGYAYMVLKGLQAQNAAYNRFIYGIEDTSTLKVYWYEKTSVSGTDWYLRVLTYPLARYSATDKLNADYIADGTTNKVFTGTEKTKLSGIEGGAQINIIEGVKVNGTAQTPDANKIISLTIPTQASDVNALPNTTKYCASCDLTINSSTYVMSLQLKDQDGNNLGTAKTIDLPLETMVVSGSYDSTNKKVVLTLQNGSTVEFSVADLVSGLQTEITAQNKLSSDLVDDTGHTHKFVNADEKSVIDNIGYLDLTSTPISSSAASPTALTDAQLAEINKKYCIIRYNSTEFYKCNDTGNIIGGNTIIFSKVQIDFANYQEQGTTARYILFYYALIVDQAAKTIYLNTDSKADLYSKAKVDNLLNTKADKSELDSVQTTTDTVANVVDVPTSAKGLATLKQIGGMSYKCKNLVDSSTFVSGDYITNEGQAGSGAGNNYYGMVNDTFVKAESSSTYSITVNVTSNVTQMNTIFGCWNGNTFIERLVQATTISNGKASCSITTSANTTKVYIYFYTADETVNLSQNTSNIMINLGSTALPYEAYYEGIHDSEVTKVESVGANIWDEEYRIGYYDGNGNYQASSSITRLCSKNYIPVEPNKVYNNSSQYSMYVYFYDKDKTFIGEASGNVTGNFTTPNNCYYINFSTVTTQTTYNHDICINVSNSAINGQYYPYVTYELAIPSGARVKYGINENCYDYIEFLENGKKYKHNIIGSILGTALTFVRNTETGMKLYYFTGVKNNSYNIKASADIEVVSSFNSTTETQEKIQIATNNNQCYVLLNADRDLSALTILFEANEETITDISDILTEQHLPIEAGGTLELVNTYNNAVPVQVTFDNGLIDVVLTNHNHDIEQQKDIDELEQYNASKESILDKMSYNAANDTLTIQVGDSSNKAEITLNDDNELVLKSYSSDASATTVSLDEDKIVLKYQTDFEEDNITHTLKLDQNGLTYDDSRLDAYYIHNIRLQCNNSTVEELSFKLLRRTDTQLTLADLKSEEVYYVKAFDVVAKINNNGNSYFTPVDNMSFYDSSETTMAFNFTYTDQLSDKSLSYDSIDVDVAEVTSVNDTVVEL